jgi:glycine cleavage system transcriptional repressor
MNTQMIISVMSRDRPGIVADVSGAIFALGGDIADLNQSVLRGYLTMILMVDFDRPLTPHTIIETIAAVQSSTTLDVMAREISEQPDIDDISLPVKTYIMTARGRNRKGLVHGISAFCRRHDINILDLATTMADDRYTMVLQLDLSRVSSIVKVREQLMTLREETGLTIMLQHHDLFKVTNEIPF